MNLLKIGDTVINLDRVECFIFDVDQDTCPDPGTVLVIFDMTDDLSDESRDTLIFRGDDARYLRRWLEKSSEDVYPRP